MKLSNAGTGLHYRFVADEMNKIYLFSGAIHCLPLSIAHDNRRLLQQSGSLSESRDVEIPPVIQVSCEEKPVGAAGRGRSLYR